MPHFEATGAGVAVDEDPITFSLGGSTFACISEIPAARVNQLVDDVNDGARNRLAVIVDFIHDVVVERQRADLTGVLLDTTSPVSNAAVVETFLWLADQYRQRAIPAEPTPQRARSAGKPRANAFDTVARWGEVEG